MVPELRQEKILEYVQARQISYIKDIAQTLGISMSTVRRDLSALEKAGSLVVMRGGAVRSRQGAFDQSVAKKRQIRTAEKDVIARRAAELVCDGDVIYVDSGTTTSWMFRYLIGKRITVVTSSTELFDYLPIEGVRFLLVGGELSEDLKSTSGHFAEKVLTDMHFTKAFIGGNGYVPDGSVYTYTENEARKKMLARECAEETYVLMDTSKKNKYGFAKVFDLEGVTLITEE